MKKIYIIAALAGMAFILFIMGDYFSLFGTRQDEITDFIELNFKTIDEETGALVTDAHVRCFQMKNHNACVQRESGQAGIVSINLPVQKIITRSILFEKNIQLRETEDPKVHIMFNHDAYASPVETIYIQGLPELTTKVMTVSMPKPMRNAE
ncbi:MAG: hypothetical protein HY356_00230 [Gammaproteobacteria bacterium]|nr:hypothetical protein [Gammaproteobacteria bacterium]